MSDTAVEQEVLEAIEVRRAAVNAALDEALPIVEPERLWTASRYLFDAGGKRLRPTVVLLTAEALADVPPGSESYRRFPDLDGEPVDIMASALSVEIIQTFTLIHDDIMDADRFRRGVETVHEAFDLEMAILAGDTLYAKSYEVILDSNGVDERVLRAIRLLTDTCTAICEGQAQDVEFEGRHGVSIDEYLRMIEEKTAVLYATSAALPGIILGADESTIDSLYAFGMEFGRAFQMQDDILDLVADTGTLGKDQASDLLEGKRTAVTIHAEEQGLDPDRLLAETGSVEAAVAALEEAGSIDFAADLARSHVDQAQSHLEVLPENEARSLLSDLASYVVERSH